MKRSAALGALAGFLGGTLLSLQACTHDWDLPLTGDDAAAPTAEGGAPDAARDAATMPFDCAGAIVCDTFDGPALGATWDDVAVGANGGKAAIEAFGGAVSAPNVFAAERPAQTDGTSTAYLAKVRAGMLVRARMELQVWPIDLDANEYATIAAIVFDHQGPNEHKIRLAVNRTRAQLQELGPSNVIASHDLPAGLSFDRWSHVAFEIDERRLRVFVNRASVLDVQADASWRASTRSLFVVGINFVTRPHGKVSLRFDDVRADGS